ncbi:EamA family transporter, partial [Halovivax sp.]|uniref:DMT family transporter n=1 Tax=Halovivax sp. TaxID=1935978 RepID=UPI0025B8E616
MTVRKDVLLFGALALVWGTSFAAIEVGLASLPPILFAALRFDVAAALFAGGVLALGLEWRPRTTVDWTLIGVGAGLVVGAHFGLLFLGQSYVSSGVAAIVLSLTPIVTPPLAIVLLGGQRLRAPSVVGLGLGLAGVVVIALSGGAVGGRALGVGLLFGSAVAFALGSVLTERLAPRGTLSLVSLQAWSMAGGALVLHAISA